jgi:hypothetical protein
MAFSARLVVHWYMPYTWTNYNAVHISCSVVSVQCTLVQQNQLPANDNFDISVKLPTIAKLRITD